MTVELVKPELNYIQLDRELDRVKTQVFRANNAAFLGSIMCSMEFSWNETIETACTNGISIMWNPYFFMSLSADTRKTILVHELWHPALLHMLRRGERDPQIWNWAADIVINNMLDTEGYSFENLSPWMDHKYDGWTTEEVYDELAKEHSKAMEELKEMLSKCQWVNPDTGEGDMQDIIEPEGGGSNHQIINTVVSAKHSATMSGCGNFPGEVEIILKQFLQPKLPWERLLDNFFNQLCSHDYSWARPNRRHRDVYLPSLMEQRDGLDHLVYFLDVSGSISDAQIIRFHSEFKHIKDTYRPAKMTMVQFDTMIQNEKDFTDEDEFEETHVIGRGGTSLVCVRNYIIEHKPTAVVIFSDLYCEVMEKLPPELNVPIIWVIMNNSGGKVNEGETIHLNE